MRLRIPLLAFLFGLMTSALQFAYLSGEIRALSDLSPGTPTVYLISGTFMLWVMLTAIALVTQGRRALWTLAIAPFALIGPALFIWLILNCSINGNCP